MNLLSKTLLGLLLSCGFLCSHAAPVTFTFSEGWSDSANPNGPWSFNYNENPISTYQTFWWGQSGWSDFWIADGAVMRGDAPSGTDPWGNQTPAPDDWLPGDIMLHALSKPYGGESTFVNVRWTSPAEGAIDISGRAWDGCIFPDRDVSWTLLINDTPIAHRASVIGLYRYQPAAQFSKNLLKGKRLKHIKVAEGDTVEFRVVAETYYGHFVGLEETIAFTPKHAK